MEEDYQLKQEAIKLFRQLGETSPAQKQYGLSYEPIVHDHIAENYTEDDELTVFFVKLMEE